jgi:hypothetical protein
MSEDELERIAGELYALTPDAFTPARTERVEQAKAAGQRTLAAAVAKLRKPNAVGWLANQLVRDQPDGVAQLLGLGEQLREATATLDRQRLRELSGRQRPAVTALVRRAGVLADEAGQPMSKATARSLEETLHAAMADPVAGARLTAGQLTAALTSTGFPGLSPDEAPKLAPPAASKAGGRTPDGDDGARLAAARADEEEARRRVAATASDAEAAAEVAQRAGRAVDEARARVAALRRELDSATRELDMAEEVHRSAKADALTARRTADRAQRALEAAEEHHRRLGGRR